MNFSLKQILFLLALLITIQVSAQDSQDSTEVPSLEDLEDGAVPPENPSVDAGLSPAPVAEVPVPAKAPAPQNPEPPPALLEPSVASSATEVESDLNLDEAFARTPLRPPMSDANWRKWAGPVLTKIYRIRKKDSLWAISERLFGTPYLWPKVWHLNARITNPNVVEPGIELQFFPGNPGAAPNLALLKSIDGSVEYLPLLLSEHQTLNTFEQIEILLKRQSDAEAPPFKTFLMRSVPKRLASVPGTERGGIFFSQGESFKTKLDNGTYSIAKVEDPKRSASGAKIVSWLGRAEVAEGRATITRAFAEIQKGDILVAENFTLDPLSLYEANEKVETSAILPLENGTKIAGDHQVIGLVFSDDEGPKPGAVVTLAGLQKDNPVDARVLIVSREKQVATAWVLQLKKEIEAK